MIASTAPASGTASTGIKNPTGSQLPPLAFLQGGGQLSDYRFSGLTGSQAQFNGMTLNEVKQVLGNYNQQIQGQFGPKKPDTVTGGSSSDQALGYIGGLGATAGTAYLANGGTIAGYGLGTGAAATGAAGATGATAAGGAALGATGAAAGGAGAVGSTSLTGALGSSAFGASAGGVGAGTAAAGTGAAGGTAAGTGASATLGSVGAVAWPLAIAASTAMAGKNYHDRAKESGNALSMEDTSTLTHMWGVPKPLRGIQSSLDKIPGSPTWITNQLFGASRQRQEKGARKVSRSGAFRDAGLIGQEDGAGYGLADGSEFSISDYKKNMGKDAYNIDFDGTENAHGVSFANALASALLGEKSRKGSDVKDGKTSSDLTGELYNAANSNGNFEANLRAMGDKLGGRNAIYEGVANQFRADRIDANKRDALFAAIDKEYGIKNETNARWEDAANLSDKDKQRNSTQLAQNQSSQPQASAQVPAQATTKPLPQKPQTLSQESLNNGGRPAPTNLTPSAPYRPGASVNPYFKGQNNAAKNPSLAKKAGEKMAETVKKKDGKGKK